MSEERVLYSTASGGLLNTEKNHVIINTEQRPLSTRNLDELERELAEIERKLLPLLNTIRAMRGEKPIYPPKR